MTELQWQWFLLLLLRRRKEAVHSADIQVLGDIQVPDEVAVVLKNGPKYIVQPTIPAHVLLSVNRCLASRTKTEDQERCILEGMDSLLRTVSKESRSGCDPLDWL